MENCPCSVLERRDESVSGVGLVQLGKANEKVATVLKEKTGELASPGERRTGMSQLLGEHSSYR